jgi:hypothetical protein
VRNHQYIVATAIVLALCTGVSARQTPSNQPGRIRFDSQQSRQIDRFAVTFIQPWRPRESSDVTRVIGSVLDVRTIPVARASVQLRNLNTGHVEQSARTSTDGTYEFPVNEPGTFVVEMLSENGSIVALSNAGSLLRYETLHTVVQLPGLWDASASNVVVHPKVTDFFGLSAATTMTAATIGLAGGANVGPADPGIPVSP